SLPRKPLCLGRRRVKRLERPGVPRGGLQGHLAGVDRPDLLTRDIADLRWLLRLDRQAVEDVALLIAFDLRNRPDDDAVRGDDIPPLRDLQPRDGIRHRSATLAPPSSGRVPASNCEVVFRNGTLDRSCRLTN